MFQLFGVYYKAIRAFSAFGLYRVWGSGFSFRRSLSHCNDTIAAKAAEDVPPSPNLFFRKGLDRLL